MGSPDYSPSEHLTPVKDAYSPDYTPSEIITPTKSTHSAEYHYPTPPGSKPEAKVASGDLRINTRITMPEDMWAKGPQRTITKSEDSLSIQERRALKSYGLYIDAYNSRQPEDVDCVQTWAAQVESVAEPELIVAMNPFYDEYEDGDYYAWLHDEYYEGHMPEIVRRANAFRGFPQLDDELCNPQGWEEKYVYYRSPTGLRDMEPYLGYIEKEQDLLEPQLCESDSRSVEEFNREDIVAFQKTWANTLGPVDEPAGITLWASSIETPTATPKKLSAESNALSSTNPASPAVETESTSGSLAARPVFTADKAEGSHVIRIKSASVVDRAAGHTAGSSSNAIEKKQKKKKKRKNNKRRRRHAKDGAYKPGRDASEDDSNNDRPRKRSKKSKM